MEERDEISENNKIIYTKSQTHLEIPKKLKLGNNDQDLTKKMINLIRYLKKLKKEGKTEEELFSLISNKLKEINKDISKIIDNNNNTLAHLLIYDENVELLILLCNIYYLLIIDKNEFYDWFLRRNNENLTLLDISSIKGNKEMLEYLYQMISKTDGSKLNFNIKENNIFHYSAKYNQSYSILFWYDKLQPFFPYLKIIDLSNQFDITPLHYACYHGAINCVELLLDLKADINAIDKEGKSVLIYAVNSGDISIIKKLLIRGADKTIKDLEGKTAYQYAIENDKYNLAPYLKNYNYIYNIKKFIHCNHKAIDIKQLIGEKNDFELIIYLFLYFIFACIFLIRILGATEYRTLESYKTYLKFGFFCFGLSGIFLFFSFILIIYFKCIISFRQHLNKNKINILETYDKTNNLCIKCGRVKKQNTIHCVVCNLCIDKWDHHCYWLNACITKNNIRIFGFFFISIICFLFINIILSLCFLTIYLREENIIRDKFIFNIFTNDIYEDKKNILIWKILYILIFIFFFILFLLLFIYNFSLIIFSKNKKINEDKESRESSYLEKDNFKDYNGGLIDSYIDKSDDIYN